MAAVKRGDTSIDPKRIGEALERGQTPLNEAVTALKLEDDSVAKEKVGTGVKSVSFEDEKEPSKRGASASKEEEQKKKRAKREEVDFEELTHVVTSGAYESFTGVKISESGDEIQLCLRKNARGKSMIEPRTILVKKSETREVDSDDMISGIDDLGGGLEDEEDKKLVAFEKGKWECSKCSKKNSNEAGYCDNMIEGKQCGGTKKCDKIIGWGNCFNPQQETWKCENCTVANNLSAQVCVACNEPRP